MDDAKLFDRDDEFRKLRSAWRAALAGSHGEVIMEDLRFYAQQQAHQPGDPYTTAFNDGMRTIATNILNMIEDKDNVSRKTKVVR